MVLFILGILILIYGIIFSAYARKQYEGKAIANISCIASCLVCVIAICISCISYVPTGYTGIITTFGKVHDTTLDAGINFHVPWDNIITMDNREQRVPFEMQAFSSDIQEVSIRGSVNLNIDKKTAMNLYREVGTGYLDILVTPRISEEIKSVISKYTAEGLITNRNNLSIEMLTLLKEALTPQGINIISVAVEDVDFSDAFTNAVEAKQVATQEKQKAQTEQEQKTMEAQQAAERKKIEASAAAEVQKIEADAAAYAVRVQAEAQAKANDMLAESLTADLIKYNAVSNWDGKLPAISTSDAMPIIDFKLD